jgi:N-acetylneuraminic acid mutarotase
MPTARAGLATNVVNGTIYAIGGMGGSTKVEAYDPATDTWTQKADLRARMFFGASVVDGKVYVIGGVRTTTGDSLASVEEYDPVTDTWTEKADMPTARDSLVTAVVDAKIYAIGGVSFESDIGMGGSLSVLEEYDPATDSWNTKASMPSDKESACVGVVSGKLYVLGGYREAKVTSSVLQYDPSTDTWESRASMPAPRAFAACAVVDDRIYLFGGGEAIDDPESSPLSTVFEYDPATDTWTTREDAPFEGWAMSSSVVNGKVYLLGGSASPWPFRSSVSTVWEYDPALSD